MEEYTETAEVACGADVGQHIRRRRCQERRFYPAIVNVERTAKHLESSKILMMLLQLNNSYYQDHVITRYHWLEFIEVCNNTHIRWFFDDDVRANYAVTLQCSSLDSCNGGRSLAIFSR